MKSRIFFFLLSFSVSVALFAQENEIKEKISYSNLTEFGPILLSPQGSSFEATTVQGIALNKKHLFGLGVGIGGIFINGAMIGMPIFFNYRYYFKPDKTFSPHLNAALGSIMLKDSWGTYSSVTAGFRVGKFTLSSGLSFLALRIEKRWYEDIYVPEPDCDYGDYYYIYTIEHKTNKWHFPLGISIKWGFAF